MDVLENLNRSLFLIINGGTDALSWHVKLAIAIGDSFIYVVPFVFLWLWLWGDRAKRSLALSAFVVVMLAVGINQVIAMVWQHPRPFMIGLGHTWIAHAPDSSFPSDHVTVLSGLGLSLLMGGDSLLAILMLVVALAVAWARVYLGVHFPFDMIGAVFVAGMSLAFVTPIWRRIGISLTGLTEQIYRRILARPIAAGWFKN